MSLTANKSDSLNCISQILPVLWHFRKDNGNYGKVSSQVPSFCALFI